MRALRLLIGASAVTYLFRCRRPRDPSYICVRYGSRDAVALRAGRGAHQASGLGCRQPGVSGSFTWTPIGSLRSPGDPSCAFAPLLDPGRTDVPLPWRSHRCCPRWMEDEGFNNEAFGAHSRSFSTRSPTLRASSRDSHARLTSGWLAGLYREGVEPSGSLRKVSDHMVIPLSCHPDATILLLRPLPDASLIRLQEDSARRHHGVRRAAGCSRSGLPSVSPMRWWED